MVCGIPADYAEEPESWRLARNVLSGSIVVKSPNNATSKPTVRFDPAIKWQEYGPPDENGNPTYVPVPPHIAFLTPSLTFVGNDQGHMHYHTADFELDLTREVLTGVHRMGTHMGHFGFEISEGAFSVLTLGELFPTLVLFYTSGTQVAE